MYQRRRTPSFSSSLLDSICHSIDESKNKTYHNSGGDKILMKKQRNYSVDEQEEAAAANLRRAIMIENWMEKQSSLSSSLHFKNNNSNSTSSLDSSCRYYYKEKSRRPKPVRSMKCTQFDKRNTNQENQHRLSQKQNPEGGFTKIKGEVKKVKQPISPGGRFASFLNSIFSSASAKKVNVCTVKAMEDVNFDRNKSKSTCSRSCVSNTPSACSSSRGNKSNNGIKRSVRFYPVGVIVDEDCRPCGRKCIYKDDPSLLPLPNVQDIVKKKENGVGTFLANKGISEFVSRGLSTNHDDDEDDALSYSSSDLFELDHLIGIGRHREELPVYGTTNLKKNQAIANAFVF